MTIYLSHTSLLLDSACTPSATVGCCIPFFNGFKAQYRENEATEYEKRSHLKTDLPYT